MENNVDDKNKNNHDVCNNCYYNDDYYNYVNTIVNFSRETTTTTKFQDKRDDLQ